MTFSFSFLLLFFSLSSQSNYSFLHLAVGTFLSSFFSLTLLVSPSPQLSSFSLYFFCFTFVVFCQLLLSSPPFCPSIFHASCLCLFFSAFLSFLMFFLLSLHHSFLPHVLSFFLLHVHAPFLPSFTLSFLMFLPFFLSVSDYAHTAWFSIPLQREGIQTFMICVFMNVYMCM